MRMGHGAVSHPHDSYHHRKVCWAQIRQAKVNQLTLTKSADWPLVKVR